MNKMETSFEEEIVYERLNFIETTSTLASSITLFVISGILVIFGIVWSTLTFMSVNAEKVSYPIRIITNILNSVVYFSVILFITFHYIKINKWFKWKEPLKITKNIVKIVIISFSSAIFLWRIIYTIIHEVLYNKHLIKGIGDIIDYLDAMRPANVVNMVMFILSCVMIVLLALFSILDAAGKKGSGIADYRAAVLALVFALVLTFPVYGNFIIIRFVSLYSNYVGYLIYNIIYGLFIALNGTAFLLLDRNKEKFIGTETRIWEA
jgi:hypothetical protein